MVSFAASTPVVVFEGIDGAGKSTISALLEGRLKARGHRVLRYTHAMFSHPDPLVEDRVRQLRLLIWDGGESNRADVSAYHRFLIISAWYDLVCHGLYGLIQREGADIVLLDGWWYRHVAKTAIRLKSEPRFLASIVNQTAFSPSARFLLEVDPEVTWSRKTYKDYELGYWDGYEHKEPRDAYIGYQREVHRAILSMDDADEWTVVPVAGGVTADNVADRILETLVEELSI